MGIDRKEFIRKVSGGTAGVFLLPLLSSCKTKDEKTTIDWTPPVNVKDEEFWESVKKQYPVAKERIYLNTAGLGPVSYPVLNKVHKVSMELQAKAETGYRMFDESRQKVADFVGVSPAEISFTRNTTEGNSIIASGLNLSRGDEVIFESHAHPGGSLPWMNRQLQEGVKVIIFEPDPNSEEGNLERINDLITPRTKVIQVSHVTAPTGIRFPVKKIAKLAHDNGIWFHIDGAQSIGMFPFDLKEIGCDSFAGSGHKWLGGPHETGFLYIDKEKLDEVKPVEVGAYSDKSYSLPDEFQYFPTSRRFEYGTRNAASVVGLGAAVDFMNTLGMNRVAAHGHGLVAYLQKELSAIEGVRILTPRKEGMFGSILTIQTDQMAYDKLYSYIEKNHNMRARIVAERGIDAVRFSLHTFISKADCMDIVNAVEKAVNQ